MRHSKQQGNGPAVIWLDFSWIRSNLKNGLLKRKKDCELRLDDKIQSRFCLDQIVSLCCAKLCKIWICLSQKQDYTDPRRRVDFMNKKMKMSRTVEAHRTMSVRDGVWHRDMTKVGLELGASEQTAHLNASRVLTIGLHISGLCRWYIF